MISPIPNNQEPEQHFVGMIIAILTTIILLLVAVILFIIARNKNALRSEPLQFNLSHDSVGMDKRVMRMKRIFSILTFCV